MKNLKTFNNKNNKIYNTFINAKINNNIPQACILHFDVKCSQEFINATLNHITHIIICENNKDINIPCQRCKNCISFKNKQYDEIFELSQHDTSSKILIGKDKNDINTMRWFQSKFYLSLAKNKNRIGIIKDADKLNLSAQNAFLKTLESPLKNNFILLSTNDSNKLIETITSRCIKIKIDNFDNIQNAQELNYELTKTAWVNINAIQNNKKQQYAEKILLIYNEIESIISRTKIITKNNNDKKQIGQSQEKNTMINAFITNSYIFLAETYIALQQNKNKQANDNNDYSLVDTILYTRYLKALNDLYEKINNSNLNINQELIILRFAKQICA